ncbi:MULTISPECIES: hypothetical protein [Calothrix]|uniref:Uncharacterized protein n=2 Tax=Calothrix TaxID=1186 RepID=A0ABR8A507_9CYAN|nr:MULTISPECIES: hypothetical protein [Calothrix]MBD2194924.1 hypothetical protein [Calothrix parietina FACHB-288]MBD2203758.1 hypothetical protein [Calothrix sp. FACHB-168]MBD2219578.1 hypothetical protein [Calothrix sp. FACHB-1219]MBD2223522.1 hypothetical protein [Calothrix anomala FACHB-343]
MKTHQLFTVVPAALAMSLVLSDANLAQTPANIISANLSSDPVVLNGKSDAAVKSNCGNIPTKPSQVIQVPKSLPYLRVTVESKGQPTLLIDGPGGKFCVLADSSEGKAELAGYWQSGQYSFYVGDVSQRQVNYTLSISQQPEKK